MTGQDEAGRDAAGKATAGGAPAGGATDGKGAAGNATAGGDPTGGDTAGGSGYPVGSRPTRIITDVETLRAISDPTRIAILRQLMSDAQFGPVIMSAKELAAALDEPQTKLYRHLKQLEAVGLIEVASSRLVSGIVEQRYRACQLDITMGRELVVDPASQPAMSSVIAAVLDDFRNEFVSNLATGRVMLRDEPDNEPTGLIIQAGAVSRLSRPRAAAFRQRLATLVEEFAAIDEDPDGVPVRMFIGWYAIDEPESSSPAGT